MNHEGSKTMNQSLAYKTIGCAMNVYSILGPGLLESVYQQAMMYELTKQGIHALSEVPVPVFYDGVDLGLGFKMDILVEETIVLELKSIKSFEDIHYKQLSNYLHLTGKPFGYLINFNTTDFCLGKGFEKIRNYKYSRPIPKGVYNF